MSFYCRIFNLDMFSKATTLLVAALLIAIVHGIQLEHAKACSSGLYNFNDTCIKCDGPRQYKNDKLKECIQCPHDDAWW